MNETDFCFQEKFLRYTNGLKIASLTIFSLAMSMMLFCVLTWHFLRETPYLKYRQFPLIPLFCIGWLCTLFTGPLYRGTFPKTNFLDAKTFEEQVYEIESIDSRLGWNHNCVFDQLVFNSIVAIFVCVQCVRVWQIFQKVRFNKKLAKYTEEHAKQYHMNLRNPASSEAQSVKSEHSLDSLRVIISFIYALYFAVDVCPQIGENVCKINAASISNIRTTLLNLLPAVLFILFFFYVVRISKKYPDPFDLLEEMNQAYIPTLVLMLSAVLLNAIDPFKILEENSKKKIGFDYAVLIDIGLNWFCLRTICIPVLIVLWRRNFEKSSRFDPKEESKRLTFHDLLRNEEGMKYFKAHLLFEFSSENLDFYITAKNWKDNYDSVASWEKRKKYAKNIYNRWLSPKGVSPVNVGFFITKKVEKNLLNDLHVRKDLFDEALDEVYLLMERDSFGRFQAKPVYKLLNMADVTSLDRISI
eukprot:snap_masked-scaffold_4-processed-gene-2.9-mRNA-1 protein AED:1.00 eAED:1.00 QI:0/0/0/0/1/1/2/0/470